MPEDADGVDIEWADQTEFRIRKAYERMAPFRRVPPPESVVYSLLLRVQNNTCFMCGCMGFGLRRNNGLIEDHDHETGMVRALLCRSCNIIEGKAGRRPWPTYRRWAPANGLYCRYFGRGEQWHGGDPDPLPDRTKLPAHAELSELILDSDAHLMMYLDVVGELSDTPIPTSCQRRFDLYSGRPLLLSGERYATQEEMASDGWGGWPIRSDPTGSAEVPTEDLNRRVSPKDDPGRGLM